MSKLRLIPYAVLTAGGLVAASGAANAQSMYDVKRIQDYQQDRIQRGVNDGQITRSEENRLERGEQALTVRSARPRLTATSRRRSVPASDRMVQQENRQMSSRQPRQPAGVGSRPVVGP